MEGKPRSPSSQIRSRLQIRAAGGGLRRRLQMQVRQNWGADAGEAKLGVLFRTGLQVRQNRGAMYTSQAWTEQDEKGLPMLFKGVAPFDVGSGVSMSGVQGMSAMQQQQQQQLLLMQLQQNLCQQPCPRPQACPCQGLSPCLWDSRASLLSLSARWTSGRNILNEWNLESHIDACCHPAVPRVFSFTLHHTLGWSAVTSWERSLWRALI
eukprot:1159472-Pelagomonas_calceolata.AAC.6